MKYAVFFRNLNLGRPHCPTKAQLEDAFISAGAGFAASFLTNGTLAFSAASPAEARQVLAAACSIMQARCGLREPAFLRRVADLARLVEQQPFAAVDRSTVYECCVTFLPTPPLPRLPALPLQSKRLDVELLAYTKAEVLSLSRKVGKSPGSPNAFLERLLALTTTTRSWSTITRLVDKHG